MTKAELIDIVAEQVEGASKAQVTAAYEAIFETIVRAVQEDEKHRFLVNGFGTFELKHRPARKGRNPATGAEMDIAASNTMAFRPASALKEKLAK
jgi:DNA-binding protein HU-beta